MSANRALSGPSALKSRPTRSGAAPACGAAGFAAPLGRLAQPRVVPAHPFSRMMRATRLRDVETPAFLSSAKTFGAPKWPRPSSQAAPMAAASSASRRSCALGGLERHA